MSPPSIKVDFSCKDKLSIMNKKVHCKTIFSSPLGSYSHSILDLGSLVDLWILWTAEFSMKSRRIRYCCLMIVFSARLVHADIKENGSQQSASFKHCPSSTSKPMLLTTDYMHGPVWLAAHQMDEPEGHHEPCKSTWKGPYGMPWMAEQDKDRPHAAYHRSHGWACVACHTLNVQYGPLQLVIHKMDGPMGHHGPCKNTWKGPCGMPWMAAQDKDEPVHLKGPHTAYKNGPMGPAIDDMWGP
ncbi:hypothetical protein EDC04DRAFT_2598020 [Pisolithus marmoratus]|nr:hypothetical protein EDC04DRAFT_2598020 [Pisolithus marmoratus]